MMLNLKFFNRHIIALFALSVCVLQGQAQTQQVQVLEYHPAPGQFVNTLPSADENTTQEEVNQRCEEQLNRYGPLVHLGTFGGYITVKFDHAIENKPGSDFLVLGNGFYANADPIYGKETIGGSIEPGIVYVGVGKDLEEANGMSWLVLNIILLKSTISKSPTINQRQRVETIHSLVLHTTNTSNGSAHGLIRMESIVIPQDIT